MANPVIALINLLLNLYWWVVIIAVIVSWLIAFNVINTYNNFVRTPAARPGRPDRAGVPPGAQGGPAHRRAGSFAPGRARGDLVPPIHVLFWASIRFGF